MRRQSSQNSITATPVTKSYTRSSGCFKQLVYEVAVLTHPWTGSTSAAGGIPCDNNYSGGPRTSGNIRLPISLQQPTFRNVPLSFTLHGQQHQHDCLRLFFPSLLLMLALQFLPYGTLSSFRVTLRPLERPSSPSHPCNSH